MSGGSYDYAYRHVDDMAANLRLTTPLRKAFADHLNLVSRAMRDIEWVDSGDKSPGGEDEAIKAVLGPQWRVAVATEIIKDGERLKAVLEQWQSERGL